MVISFFGHANFSYNEQFFNNVVTELKEIIGDRQVEFFVGYYGNFERFGVRCAKEIKKNRKPFDFRHFLVEVTGFEPATFWSRTKRATKLRYTSILWSQ